MLELPKMYLVSVHTNPDLDKLPIFTRTTAQLENDERLSPLSVLRVHKCGYANDTGSGLARATGSELRCKIGTTSRSLDALMSAAAPSCAERPMSLKLALFAAIFSEPIREVWIPDQRFEVRRLSMSRIMAGRTNAAALRA